MKQFATLLVMTLGSAFAQDCLVNTYSSYSEVYGGMEDSGIQRTSSYIFVAQCALTVQTIHLDGKAIIMKKGDTLQVIVQKTIPYNGDEIYTKPAVSKELPIDHQFRTEKRGNVIFVHVQPHYEWSESINYTVRKKMYLTQVKSTFDATQSDAAP